MSSAGNSYYFDGTTLYKCAYGTFNIASCQQQGAITIGGTERFSLGTVDSTETNAYYGVLDTNTGKAEIKKCVISTGACTVYLSATQSIGKQLDGTDIFFMPDTSTGAGGAIDSSNNIYFVGYYVDSNTLTHFDLYKCTGVNTCSQILNTHSFYSMNDDFAHSIRYSSTQVDSAGISYRSYYCIKYFYNLFI